MTFDIAGIPSPDNRKATLYLNGASCYNNKFLFSHLNASPYMIMFDNGAFRNSVHAQHWGNVVNIKDDGAGTRNIIYVEEGSVATGTADTKITSTAGNVRIIDERTGASNSGSSVQSGTGAATTAFYVTLGATNITLNYTSAPANGTNNLTWYWNASVYP